MHATTTAKPPPLAAHRGEHLFFSGMAWLLVAINLVAFARPYYLAGPVAAPLPSAVKTMAWQAVAMWVRSL